MRKPTHVNIMKYLNACMGQKEAMKKVNVNMAILACAYFFKQEDAKKETIAIITIVKIEVILVQLQEVRQEILSNQGVPVNIYKAKAPHMIWLF